MQFNLSKIFCPAALSSLRSFKIPLWIWFLCLSFWLCHTPGCIVLFFMHSKICDDFAQWQSCMSGKREIFVHKTLAVVVPDHRRCIPVENPLKRTGPHVAPDPPRWTYKTQEAWLSIYHNVKMHLRKSWSEIGSASLFFQLSWILHLFLGSYALFYLFASCQDRKMESKSARVVVFSCDISLKELRSK